MCQSRLGDDWILKIAGIIATLAVGAAAGWFASNQNAYSITQNDINGRMAALEEERSYPKVSWSVDGQGITVKNHEYRQFDRFFILFFTEQKNSKTKFWHLNFLAVAPCTGAKYIKFKPGVDLSTITVTEIRFRYQAGKYWQIFPDSGPPKLAEKPPPLTTTNAGATEKDPNVDMVGIDHVPCG